MTELLPAPALPELPGIETRPPPDPRYTVDDYSAGGLLVDLAQDRLDRTRAPLPSISRWLERQSYAGYDDELGIARPPRRTARQLSADEANQVYGIDGHLHFSADTPEPVAEDLYRLKRAELFQQDLLRRRKGGAMQELGLLLRGLAVQATDPLNVASAFIPAVGPVRYALALKAAAGAGERAMIRAGVGAIEGAIGAAVVEPIVYGVAVDEQADYSLADSLLNVAFGTVLGGGLHAGAGALGDRLGLSAFASQRAAHFEALRGLAGRDATLLEVVRLAEAEQPGLSRLQRAVDAAPLELKEAALRQAVSDVIVHGEVRNVEALLRRALGNAYDEALANPLRGNATDVLATIPIDDIERVLVERGPAQAGADGEVTLRGTGQGYGMVKVIWKHGENAPTAGRQAVPPLERVSREDVLAMPQTMRDFEPSTPPEVNPREWRLPRQGPDGRTYQLVYAAKRYEQDGPTAPRHLVTVFVDRDPKKPLSVPRVAGPDGSPSGSLSPAGDTARGLPITNRTEGQTGPATANVGPPLDPDKTAADQATALAGRASAFDRLAERAVSAASAAGSRLADPVLERAMAMIDGLKKLGRVQEADLAGLRDAEALAAQAEGERRAWDIAASCAVGRGG